MRVSAFTARDLFGRQLALVTVLVSGGETGVVWDFLSRWNAKRGITRAQMESQTRAQEPDNANESLPFEQLDVSCLPEVRVNTTFKFQIVRPEWRNSIDLGRKRQVFSALRNVLVCTTDVQGRLFLLDAAEQDSETDSVDEIMDRWKSQIEALMRMQQSGWLLSVLDASVSEVQIPPVGEKEREDDHVVSPMLSSPLPVVLLVRVGSSASPLSSKFESLLRQTREEIAAGNHIRERKSSDDGETETPEERVQCELMFCQDFDRQAPLLQPREEPGSAVDQTSPIECAAGPARNAEQKGRKVQAEVHGIRPTTYTGGAEQTIEGGKREEG
uniref:Uncharacterized protein n=1 Tax=Chromera velia CCMP2878 TaxID=1169474 RepID=A0A0G4I2Y3_9ALVE|eukprot:Cvel_1725.t1-p1 / transcript=Cvel_1725.t1 / gene=Cvel_1725 / organism=Chromera_velia_CCMP2878 / gene_product=hypothetical protein / transcript_product=hypothetical protein / location=Cvel_scaffold62:135814-138176(+) / protein_length=328 / sequence_SO=supercontig / SO=protein_coding / is_pseudo=false